MKVVLIHGKDTNPSQKWYPWFQKEMKSRGIEFFAPGLPHADNPVYEEWKEEIEKTSPDENTILVGHSRGGVAILRWLEQLPEYKKVKKVILIATNSGFRKKMSIPSETNYGFYNEKGYDFEKIKKHCDSFVVFHSKDDKWVPHEAGVENKEGLGAKFYSFDDRGHFGSNIKEIPNLIDEIME